MGYEIEEIKRNSSYRRFMFNKIIDLLRVIDDTGYYRQYHNGEEESRKEFLQYKKVEYFKVSPDHKVIKT